MPYIGLQGHSERGTPSGALEMIAHIPPLDIWCNLSIYGMMAHIHTLPDNHLLKMAWQGSLVKPAYRRVRLKQRPRNLPSDNPNERLRMARGVFGEQFDVYHEANKPGCRVEDIYGVHIIRDKMDAPKKMSDDFKQWVVEYKEWLVNEVEADSDAMVIYTDGGYWKDKRVGCATYVVWENGHYMEADSSFCPAASSYDAEIVTLGMVLEWLMHNQDRIRKTLQIFIDNKGVIQGSLNMDVHSNQMESVQINLRLLHLLSETQLEKVYLTYCLSHAGIKGNERADDMASRTSPNAKGPVILKQHFMEEKRRIMNEKWRMRASTSEYRGRQWLAVWYNKKRYIPKIGVPLKGKDILSRWQMMIWRQWLG